MYLRSKKGTIAAYLLMLAVIGLAVVLSLIAIELFIKWTSLNRIQHAAQAASLAFARELVKLRDNDMGTTFSQTGDQTSYSATLARSPRASTCSFSGIGGPNPGGGGGGAAYRGCTPVDPDVVNVAGAEFVETMNASQILLFELRNLGVPGANNQPIKDAQQINDVTQFQCYKPANRTRFSLFRTEPLRCSGQVGALVSPILDLQWEFEAAPYGVGICSRVTDGDNSNKDFCVETKVHGRLDPIIAGGLPFLNGTILRPVAFINPGRFALTARAIVMRPEFNIDAGQTRDRAGGPNRDQYVERGVQNYSAESIGIESCNSQGGPCGR